MDLTQGWQDSAQQAARTNPDNGDACECRIAGTMAELWRQIDGGPQKTFQNMDKYFSATYDEWFNVDRPKTGLSVDAKARNVLYKQSIDYRDVKRTDSLTNGGLEDQGEGWTITGGVVGDSSSPRPLRPLLRLDGRQRGRQHRHPDPDRQGARHRQDPARLLPEAQVVRAGSHQGRPAFNLLVTAGAKTTNYGVWTSGDPSTAYAHRVVDLSSFAGKKGDHHVPEHRGPWRADRLPARRPVAAHHQVLNHPPGPAAARPTRTIPRESFHETPHPEARRRPGPRQTWSSRRCPPTHRPPRMRRHLTSSRLRSWSRRPIGMLMSYIVNAKNAAPGQRPTDRAGRHPGRWRGGAELAGDRCRRRPLRPGRLPHQPVPARRAAHREHGSDPDGSRQGGHPRRRPGPVEGGPRRQSTLPHHRPFVERIRRHLLGHARRSHPIRSRRTSGPSRRRRRTRPTRSPTVPVTSWSASSTPGSTPPTLTCSPRSTVRSR